MPVSVATFALLVSAAAGTAFMYSKDESMVPTSQMDNVVASVSPPIQQSTGEVTPVEPVKPPTPTPAADSSAPAPANPQTESTPAAQAAAEPAPAPSKLTSWPTAAIAHEAATQHAYNTVFKAWAVPSSPPGGDPCAYALDYGLRCFRGGGNLGTLISTDRPAILTLRDLAGNVFEAPLTALDQDSATIVFSHGEETIDRNLLERHWFGEYLIFWRLTPQGLAVLRPGDRGSSITWLSDVLAGAGFTDQGSKRSRYDEVLAAAVQSFQLQHGLKPDGIAGRQTLIRLNTLNDPSVPRLSATAGG